jgi:hypothetical protein
VNEIFIALIKFKSIEDEAFLLVPKCVYKKPGEKGTTTKVSIRSRMRAKPTTPDAMEWTNGA